MDETAVELAAPAVLGAEPAAVPALGASQERAAVAAQGVARALAWSQVLAGLRVVLAESQVQAVLRVVLAGVSGTGRVEGCVGRVSGVTGRDSGVGRVVGAG